MLTSQNMHLDRSKSIGLTMEADIVFDSSYGQVHNVLTNFLGFTEPSLHVACGLRLVQDWPSFQLTGILPMPSPNRYVISFNCLALGHVVLGIIL